MSVHGMPIYNATKRHELLEQIQFIVANISKVEYHARNFEIDFYGASFCIARALGLNKPLFSRSTWSHGWTWFNFPSSYLIRCAEYKGRNILVRSKFHEVFLKKNGFLKSYAVGLPFIYVDVVTVTRIPDSILVFPIHTTQCATITVHEETNTYVDYLQHLKERFSLVVASVGYEDVRRGNWIPALEKAGIPWIAGAWSYDKNALLRVQGLMRQFEYTTSNAPGSHFAYAAYCGCKMSFSGPRCETLGAEFDTHPHYKRYPDIAKEMKERDLVREFADKFPFFFVEPEQAVEHIEWAREELGEDNRKPHEEIAELFEWKLRKLPTGRWTPINKYDALTNEELFAKATAKSIVGKHKEALNLTNILNRRHVRLQEVDVIRARYFMSINNTHAAREALKEELRHFPDNEQATGMLMQLAGNRLAPYTANNKEENEFIDILNTVRPFTRLNIKRAKSLYTLAVRICQDNVPGNFVECGVAAGGSTMLLALVVQKHSKIPRKVFAFDTFTGMPDPGEDDTANGVHADDTGWGTGTCAAPEEFVRAHCKRLGVGDIVETRKGLFEDTLPIYREEVGEIALLHMDADWYSSTITILDNLFGQLHYNALIQIDDYRAWDGCKKAIHDFSTHHNLFFNIHEIDGTGVWCAKPLQIANNNDSLELVVSEPVAMQLPPVRDTKNDIAREDKRLPRSLSDNAVQLTPTSTVEEMFLDTKCTPEKSDLYVIRRLIKASLQRVLPLFRGLLLDVGCGKRPYESYIRRNNPNISNYIGLDFYTGKYAEDTSPDLVWDGVDIPLADSVVDCVMATEVLEHCPSPYAVLNEIRRILKPDGVLFFTTPFLWPLHDTPHDHFRYTPYSLRNILHEVGFEDVKIHGLGGWNSALAQMIGLWLRRSPMPEETRRQMQNQLFPLFEQLAHLDNNHQLNIDHDNTMAVGWSGVAYAPLVAEVMGDNAIKEGAFALRVCLARKVNTAYTETFIDDHIAYLGGVLDVIHGRPFPVYRADDTCIFDTRKKELLDFADESKRQQLYTEFLAQYLRKNRYDVVLAEYGPVGCRMYAACEKAGIPCVVHFHGHDAYVTKILTRNSVTYRDMFQRAQRFVAVSEAMRTQLINLGVPADKCLLNPYGVSIARKDIATPESVAPIFLAVGRFVEKKAPHFTIQAFSLVYKQNPTVRLVMAGDGLLIEQCKNLAVKLGIADAVNFVGVQSRRSIAKLMRSSRAFVQHSITAESGDSEGLPLAILEAGAAGLPVISTRHAGIPDAVVEGENGFLVDEGDIERMAQAMLSLVKNPKLAQWMGNNFRCRIEEHFSRRKSIEGLRAILQEVCAK
jgi:glycosyltransferase involved in cell wall biosynthesis/ubiquinone/menaquinone biosynthesis C-methylase UbiE